LNSNSNGFLEKLSLKAIVAGIGTFLGLFFAFPEYILNVRPQIEKVIGISSLSFIEGAISGSVVTIIVLKLLADRSKRQKKSEEKKIKSEDVKVIQGY
jgi:hypothetical protein